MTTSDQSLGIQLAKHVENAVLGTRNVTGDVSLKGEKTETYNIMITVPWTITSRELRGETTFGYDSIDGAHWGGDVRGFKQEIATRMSRAIRDMSMPLAAAQQLAKLGVAGLDEKERILHDFGPMSVNLTCRSCAGEGSIRCNQCMGRGLRQCPRCIGSGLVTESQWDGEKYRETRISCDCWNGELACDFCVRSGSLRCNKCGGHGGHTHYSHICAVASKRSHVVASDTGLRSAEASAFFASISTNALTRWADFSNAGIAARAANAGAFEVHYPGTATATEAVIDVKGQTYLCFGLGNPSKPIAKPPIFNYLLAAEIFDPPGRRCRRSKISERLKQLRTLRMPAAAMEHIAAGHPPADAVSMASEGYITSDAAQRLGQSLKSVLNIVSPSYAALPWVIMSIPAVLASATGALVISATDHRLAIKGGVVIAVLITASMLHAALSPVAAALSRMMVTYQRRTLPKALRQRTASFRPFKPTLIAVMFAAVVGAGLGVFDQRLGAASPVRPLVLAANDLCNDVYLKSSQFLTSRLGGLLPSQGELNPVSEANVTRQVQNKLRELGYDIGAIDGRMGPKTRRALGDYARSKGLPESSGILMIHAHMLIHERSREN